MSTTVAEEQKTSTKVVESDLTGLDEATFTYAVHELGLKARSIGEVVPDVVVQVTEGKSADLGPGESALVDNFSEGLRLMGNLVISKSDLEISQGEMETLLVRSLESDGE